MIRINLLPENEQFKKRQQRSWFMMGITVLCVVFCSSVSMHWMLARQIQQQQRQNHQLESEILSIELKMNAMQSAQSQKSVLSEHLIAIEALQSSRMEVVHLFEGLASIIPSGLYLDNFIRERDNLIFIGGAESTLEISQLMKQMHAHPSFQKSVRIETQTPPEGGLRFHLSLGGLDATAAQ